MQRASPLWHFGLAEGRAAKKENAKAAMLAASQDTSTAGCPEQPPLFVTRSELPSVSVCAGA
jgi:hypothetical protein